MLENLINEALRNSIIHRRLCENDLNWELRDIHKEALKNIFDELDKEGKCKGIIQMPTGAGKSTLMAFIASILCKIKKYFDDWRERDLVLVLAPLNRIKEQLYNSFIKTAGKCRDRIINFLVNAKVSYAGELECVIDDENIEEEFQKYYLGALRSVPKTIEGLLNIWTRYKEKHEDYKDKLLVLFLYPDILKKEINISGEVVMDKLKDRLLAIFIDEIHYGYPGKRGFLIKHVMNEVPVILGFTATPTRDALEILGKILYNKSSIDLMREASERIKRGEDPILIPKIDAYFYKTVHEVRIYHDEKEYWSAAIENRVLKYAKILLEKFSEEELRRMKILILAPNIREAEIWRKYLQGKFRVFIAHTKVENPQSEIKMFKNSTSGILIAVDMVKLGFDDPNLDLLVIARPVRSPVGYVQMRGRVVRWPKNKKCYKYVNKHALLIHLASDRIMECEDVIKRAELGTEEKVKLDLSGYGEGAKELNIGIKMEFLGKVEFPERLPDIKQVKQLIEVLRINAQKNKLYQEILDEYIKLLEKIYPNIKKIINGEIICPRCGRPLFRGVCLHCGFVFSPRWKI